MLWQGRRSAIWMAIKDVAAFLPHDPEAQSQQQFLHLAKIDDVQPRHTAT
ncbi:MAG TPA: hypothetical protein VF398_05675 [bacterium]|jgi:hypothetical protein